MGRPGRGRRSPAARPLPLNDAREIFERRDTGAREQIGQNRGRGFRVGQRVVAVGECQPGPLGDIDEPVTLYTVRIGGTRELERVEEADVGKRPTAASVLGGEKGPVELDVVAHHGGSCGALVQLRCHLGEMRRFAQDGAGDSVDAARPDSS